MDRARFAVVANMLTLFHSFKVLVTLCKKYGKFHEMETRS